MLSNIKYIDDKYILNLPLIKRQFDSLFINYKKVNSSFGTFFDGVFFENIIFGVSNFKNKKLFYSLDLEKFCEEEFLVSNIDFFKINIFNKKYSILVLLLESGKYKILSQLNNSDFIIFIESGFLKVKNLELDSIIFKNKLYALNNNVGGLNLSNNKIIKKENYTSILDIYFYKNFFIKSKHLLTFGEELENFIFEDINLNNDFFLINKLEVFEKGSMQITTNFKYDFKANFNLIFFHKKGIKDSYERLQLLKTFLQFKNNYDFVLDSINYYNLKKYFKEFNMKGDSQLEFGKVSFGKINLEKIDENLENINKQIQNFSLNYYELQKNYDKINELNIENKNSKILEQNKRLKIFKKDLEKMKKEYLNIFREFLDKII